MSEQSKPREFFICPEELCEETGSWLGASVYTEIPKDKLLPFIHVIEYAAFEKLQKDWEEAATKNYADKCEIEKLKKQNEILREALEFYAKEMMFIVKQIKSKTSH